MQAGCRITKPKAAPAVGLHGDARFPALRVQDYGGPEEVRPWSRRAAIAVAATLPHETDIEKTRRSGALSSARPCRRRYRMTPGDRCGMCLTPLRPDVVYSETF